MSARLLLDLWRIVFKTDARSSFGDVKRFGLWESPTGLYFFDPPRDGDQVFYKQLYAWYEKWRLYTGDSIRQEFLIAAKHIPPGARVLDVGCGHGGFRQCAPQADYTGLDPNFGDGAAIAGVRNETLAQHLVEHEASYDAVCCFQVIEHVRDPKALFAEIMRAAKPGGLIFIGAPHVPSALTRIPNFMVNAPPHHLTWWTKPALIELATSAGAIVESVDNAPWSDADGAMYWMARLSPIKCADIHFRGGIAWHAASVIAQIGGYLAFRLFGAPRRTDDEGAGLLLLARKPSR